MTTIDRSCLEDDVREVLDDLAEPAVATFSGGTFNCRMRPLNESDAVVAAGLETVIQYVLVTLRTDITTEPEVGDVLEVVLPNSSETLRLRVRTVQPDGLNLMVRFFMESEYQV